MVNGEVVKLNYHMIVADSYRYGGSVENHNALMHYGGTKPQCVLEIAWGTTWWTIQVFSLLSVNQSDFMYGEKYLLMIDDSFVNFRNFG